MYNKNNPWVQVEATKFTETGFHGRDVDQIIRDLVENALALTKQKLRERNKQQIEKAVEEYILRQLCGVEANSRTIVCPLPYTLTILIISSALIVP